MKNQKAPAFRKYLYANIQNIKKSLTERKFPNKFIDLIKN